MEKQSVTVKLPTKLYRRLEHLAKETNQSLDALLLKTISNNLPPFLDDLPLSLRSEFRGMLRLDDDELWSVAHGPINQSVWRKHRRLLEKNATGNLNATQAKELEQLRSETDRAVLRKSFALALLKWRGYSVALPSAPLNAKS